MRVALINPNCYLEPPVIPVGLEYLAHYLDREGHQVEVIDLAFSPGPFVALRSALHSFDPQVAGFSVRNIDSGLYHDNTFFLDQAAEFISECRRCCEAKVVLGGVHPTILPEEVLSHGADLVVMGEGERTIQEVVELVQGRKRLEEISGLAYKKDGVVAFTPPRPLIENLDELPLPARHLFRTADYVRHPSERERFGHLFTSRGCPFHCTYCSNHAIARAYEVERNITRYNSVEKVLGEVEIWRRSSIWWKAMASPASASSTIASPWIRPG